eukprot:CAMPEP_0114054920 /NCGR_PEP_ID=MMETSP1339-20121228/88540_1 /TAXON_ID=94617 /ORGANISM="Fibrocapsa japonica" /LENGTH=48 /assembly_acc=CAM_ASM_000762
MTRITDINDHPSPSFFSLDFPYGSWSGPSSKGTSPGIGDEAAREPEDW